MKNKQVTEYSSVLANIKEVIRTSRRDVFTAVNTEMLKSYFEIGRNIVEEEQKGGKRAEYGKQLIEALSKELTEEFGKGFGATALRDMRKFYLLYKNKIHQSVTGEFYKLTWTHYCELMKIKDETKRNYFENYTIKEHLSVRDLKRQMYSLHYERLLLSKDKNALLEYERRGNSPTKPEELIKDPYILEFLNLEEKHTYSEKELETSIDNCVTYISEIDAVIEIDNCD